MKISRPPENPETPIVQSIVRARNQLKVVQPAQRLSEAEVLKEFGR